MPANIVVPAPLRENYNNEINKFTTGEKKNVVSYDNLMRHSMNPREALILDEAHRIGDPETERFKSILPYASQHDKRILLTGTPIKNYPNELAALAAVLHGGKEVLPLKKSDFYNKFVEKREVFPGLINYMMGVKPGVEEVPKNLEEIAKVFRGKVDYQPSSSEGFPEKSFTTREIPMSQEQYDIYKYVTSKADPYLAYKVKNNLPPSKQELLRMNAFMTAARMVSNNTTPYGGTESSSNKIKAVVDDFEERYKNNPNHKGVIYSNFLEGGLNPIHEELISRGIPSAVFDGSLSDKDRKRIVEDYNKNKLRALLISSAGTEGLNLKGTRTTQVVEPHWHNIRLQQAEGRGARFGSHDHLPEDERNMEVIKYLSTIKPNFFQKIFGGKTMSSDEYLYNLSKKKEDLNNKFLDILKREGSRR